MVGASIDVERLTPRLAPRMSRPRIVLAAFHDVTARAADGGKARMTDLLGRVAKERSAEAFGALYDAYCTRVKAFMMRQGADAATAEELAQETLLTVWRKAALYSPDKGSASTWIFTIARNLRIDKLRRETVWQELPDDHADSVASDDPLPDEAASVNERQARVRSVLAALPEDQREVVVLAYIEGLSHSEIASRLSLPLGTVKSRMRLAYDKVRKGLEDLK